jgi:hypothetical protein
MYVPLFISLNPFHPVARQGTPGGKVSCLGEDGTSYRYNVLIPFILSPGREHRPTAWSTSPTAIATLS